MDAVVKFVLDRDIEERVAQRLELELALAAAEGIAGIENVCIFSVGSDGTDGSTDAAGGYVDGNTRDELDKQGINIYDTLKNNDAYHALEKSGGLIKTGATGTNVNDLSVLLIRYKLEGTIAK